MIIVIDEKKSALDDFRVMISSDKVNYKKSFDLIVLQIDTECFEILFYDVINVLDLIICLEIINRE